MVAETTEEAVKLAQEKTGDANLKAEDLRQDEDCLDTWFSSWLWPISLFNGINDPNNEEINYYYPTSDLVTGPDIIFFWVARMIMAGYEYKGDMPFKNVYFTGIVRDKLGRKMSKSLGNSPDPLDLIERYGADGVRMGMMLSAPAGNDILFDDTLCEQGRNFNINMECIPLDKRMGSSRHRAARICTTGNQMVRQSARQGICRNRRFVQQIPSERSTDGGVQTVLGRILKLVSRND